MANIQQLDDELEKINGGIQSDGSNGYHGTYLCPLCSNTHDFIAKQASNSYYIDDYDACGKTNEIYFYSAGFPSGQLTIVDLIYKDYITSYTFDYYYQNGKNIIVKHL